MAVLFLIFKGNSTFFFIATLPVYNPTNSAQRFPFLHIFDNTWCCPFHGSHYDRCEGTSHYGFNMFFLDTVVLAASFFPFIPTGGIAGSYVEHACITLQQTANQFSRVTVPLHSHPLLSKVLKQVLNCNCEWKVVCLFWKAFWQSESS